MGTFERAAWIIGAIAFFAVAVLVLASTPGPGADAATASGGPNAGTSEAVEKDEQ